MVWNRSLSPAWYGSLSDGEHVLKIEGDGGSLGARIERSARPIREPTKFEAGQVVRVVERDGAAIALDIAVIVEMVRDGMFWCVDARSCDNRYRFSGISDSHYFGILSPAPRAGDTWASGESVARIEADGAQLRIVSEGEPFVGDVVAVARKLWERGYRRVGTEAAQRILKVVDVREDRIRGEEARDSSVTMYPMPEGAGSAVGCSRVDRAAGDDLRRLAEVYGVLPELRAGMVVRENVAQPAWGVVQAVRARGFTLRWSCGTTVHHDSATFGDRVASGTWTIVDPDVRPLASLAYAVAAIFAPPGRATSRRYVDEALALLRGEPFVDAIRAALVGTSERTNLTPSEISACIAALRHWEARRPFDRDLGALQRRTNDFVRGGLWNRLQGEATDVLLRALGYRPVWDYDNLWFLYERARSSR